jgi:hypothetical protein
MGSMNQVWRSSLDQDGFWQLLAWFRDTLWQLALSFVVAKYSIRIVAADHVHCRISLTWRVVVKLRR